MPLAWKARRKLMLPVVSVSRDPQDNTYDRVDRDEARPRQNLIVQTEAIVIPLAVIGPVQFQGSAAAATKSVCTSGIERAEARRNDAHDNCCVGVQAKTSIRTIGLSVGICNYRANYRTIRLREDSSRHRGSRGKLFAARGLFFWNVND